MSIARLATITAAALLLWAGPSLAKVPAMDDGVPQSVIDAGPVLQDYENDDTTGRARAEFEYLAKVCPTVLAHSGSERANLVTFCNEYKG